MKVKNKVIVVTGGGSGIGRQLVLQLIEKGAVVAAVDVNVDALNETKNLVSSPSANLSLHQIDIANRASVSSLVAAVLGRHGCVDALINNAGIIHPFHPINELDYNIIESMINVNFYGVINISKAFLPLLLMRPTAHIANISSMGGLFAFPNQTFYGASKAAVKLFSEGLYAELKNTNVGVTVVFPGAINTNITKNCGAHNERIEKFKRIYKGTPAETAARCIIAGIEKRRFKVTVGIDAKILSFLYRVCPRLTIVLVGKVMKMAMPD
jgi:short-subunit dehydrogenase